MHLTKWFLLEHLGTMCLCTVWLRNKVEAMEFLEGLQTQENITDGHILDSDLVAFSTDKLSAGTDLMHKLPMQQTFINCTSIAISDMSFI